MRTLAFAFSLSSLVSSLDAQVVRGGDFLITDPGSTPTVWRVDGGGNVTPLLSGAPLQSPTGVITTRAGDIVVADFRANALIRIDRATGTATTFATGLGGPLRVVEMRDGDFAVTASSSRSILRVTPGGVVSTLASGTPLTRPFAVSLDFNGDLLVADDLGRTLHRVTPAGAATTLVSTGLQLPQGTALFPNGDYAVIDGRADVVYRVDRATNAVSTWVTSGALGVNPEGIVTDWSGGFFVAHSGSPGGPGIRRVDAAGMATPVPTMTGPWSNPEDVALVPTLLGPSEVLPSVVATYDVDVPQAAGGFYTLILSGSVFPGWSFPNSDPRALFVNPDAFALATIGINAVPFFNDWTAGIPNSGSMQATIDLTLLPPGILSGFSAYLQGLVISPSLTPQDGTPVIPLSFR